MERLADMSAKNVKLFAALNNYSKKFYILVQTLLDKFRFHEYKEIRAGEPEPVVFGSLEPKNSVK